MRKVDGDSAFEERSPQWRHLLTLTDRIRGDKRSFDRRPLHVVRRFAVPTSDIIQQTVLLHAVKDQLHICSLLSRFIRVADERRIPHNEAALLSRQNALPVHRQRIAFVNGSRISQREVVDLTQNDRLGFNVCLQLRNPQGRARNRHREVVDLNPVKLTQRHFDRTVSKLLKVEHRLVTQQLAYNDVLQAPQLNVGFRQEVAAAARWIIHAVHLGFTHQS